MHPRYFALYGGLLMLAIGAVSLVPSLAGSTDGLPPLNLETSYGWFLGIFPMNIINKLALIAFGLGGIVASNARFTSLPSSIQFSRLVFYVMGAVAIAGLIPTLNTVGGYWPLFGGEVIIHGVFAIAGAYFGYVLTSKVPNSGPAIRDFTTSMKGSH